MLQCEALTMQFGGLKALDSINYSVDTGSIVGLIGPNGAGKTTVFNVINRFVTPQSGRLFFEGQDLLKLAPHKILDWGIVRTFQNLGLFPYLTVMENLLLGQHHLYRSSPFAMIFNSRRSQSEDSEMRNRASNLLETLNLGIIQDAFVAALPYGTQKFVEVCRALISEPKLMLLDEPAAGLTHAESEQMRQLILRARDDFGITILLIEHDMSLVMRTCDEVIAFDFGKVIASGSPEQIQNDKKVIEAYLGSVEEENSSA